MWIPKLSEDHQSSTFLLASWHELFHGFTPDSCQPRLHNIPSIVDELVDIAERMERQPKYAHQVSRIQAELRAILAEEGDILALVPSYQSSLCRLNNAQSPKSLVAQGRVVMSSRDQYWTAFNRLANESVATLPRTKEAAHKNLRRLATFALQKQKEDDDVWEPLNKDVTRDPEAVFEELVRLTCAEGHEYECTLSILGNTSIIHSLSRKQGFATVKKSSLPDEYTSRIGDSGNVLHIQKTIHEASYRAAVSAARKDVAIEMGLASLYANPSKLHLHNDALVRLNGQTHVFVQSEQAFRRLHPRTNAKFEIDEAIQLLKTHGVDGRIISAVEQLSIASANPDTRTKLVSLWASVETLAGSHEGNTTMERVNELIVPLVISRHVHRMTRYLTILAQQYCKHVGSTDLGVGFLLKPNSAIRLEDMLATLSAPENSPRIVELLDFVQHPLLRFRVFRTWKSIHDPKSLLLRLKTSKRRLEWQLARIYRARNLLVHEGEEVKLIEPLLDNLQNYLSTLVQRIIHELKLHPDWSLRELIEFWRSRMLYCFDKLNKNASQLTSRDFLETGEAIKLWL